MNKQRMVQDFMQAAEQEIPSCPAVPGIEIRRLRLKLIYEELDELAYASGWILNYENIEEGGVKPFEANLIGAADAIADLLYVVYGAAVAWGIKIDEIFSVIHESNMEKFTGDSYKRSDGKWQKPSNWQPPDIINMLRKQGWDG